MPLKLLSAVALISLAVASQVMAQQDAGQSQGAQPGSHDVARPTDPRPNSDMTAARPDANAGPDREAFEDKMEQSLKEWQGRVDGFADQANASGDVNRKALALRPEIVERRAAAVEEPEADPRGQLGLGA